MAVRCLLTTEDQCLLLNDVHRDHDHRSCPAVLSPVSGAKAHCDHLPCTVLCDLGAFRIFRDDTRLNVEETRPVAVVVERELSAGLDRDATHAELTPSHPLYL